MNEIEMLLNELEKMILDGKRKTFSDEISINRQHALAVMHDLKNAVPDRLKEADYIIKNRDQIISDAEEKARNVLDNANKRANAMLDESEILRTAEKEAKAMINDTRRYLDKLEIETRRSLQETIGECENTLGDTLNLLRNCREDLKGSLLKSDDGIR